MTRRIAIALAALALAAPAVATAQDDPFAPLPQAAPATPEPTPAATPAAAGQDTGTQTLFLIGAALLVAFVGIGWWIARDARRGLPADERRRGRHAMAEPAPGEPRPRHRDPRAKQRARKRGRAQRRARRHNRPA